MEHFFHYPEDKTTLVHVWDFKLDNGRVSSLVSTKYELL